MISTHASALDSVTELALGPGRSHAVFLLLSLDVPDQLLDGPRTVDELAASCSVLPLRLRQALRLASTADLFSNEGNDRYALTERGRVLVRDHPGAARDLVLFFQGKLISSALDAALESARTGVTGIEVATGSPTFAALAADPVTARHFNRMMIAAHGDEPAAVAAAYAFPDPSTVVDCGGGLGGLLTTLLDANPGMHGTLFDQTEVVAHARDALRDAPVRDRLSFATGDLFEQVPSGAGFYLLSHVLHDWDDQAAVTILTRCREAMTTDSRLLVVEGILGDDDELTALKLQNFVIGICAGGAERTEAEYRTLFAAAGLDLDVAIATSNPAVSILEATAAR